MLFSSIKEMNRLISKRMANIYSKVIIEKNWPSKYFDFLSFKKLSPGQEIQLNFKISSWNLKTRGLGGKAGVAILLL